MFQFPPDKACFCAASSFALHRPLFWLSAERTRTIESCTLTLSFSGMSDDDFWSKFYFGGPSSVFRRRSIVCTRSRPEKHAEKGKKRERSLIVHSQAAFFHMEAHSSTLFQFPQIATLLLLPRYDNKPRKKFTESSPPASLVEICCPFGLAKRACRTTKSFPFGGKKKLTFLALR